MKENQTRVKRLMTLTTSLALAAGGTVAGMAPAQALPASAVYVNYESNDSIADDFVAFNGGSAQVVDAPTGNNSGKALKFTKAGTDPASGVTLLGPTSTSFQYTDGTHSVIRLDYFSGSSAPSPVQLKVEKEGLWSTAIVREAAPGWNHLSFDFAENGNFGYAFGAGPHPAFDKVSIFPNFGASIPNYDNSGMDFTYSGAAPVALGDVYYVDNISINDGTSADVISTPPPARVASAITMTFESSDALSANVVGPASNSKWQGTFGSAGSIIENAITGGNGTKALKFEKGIVDVWSGLNFLDVTEGTNRLTDATHKLITMNYFNALSVNSPITVKLDANVKVVRQATPGWSKLTFDMSEDTDWSSSTEYKQMVVYPNWDDVTGTGAGISAIKYYYIDNVGINGGTTPAIPAAVTKATVTRAAAVAGTAKKAKVLTGTAATFGGSTSTKTNQWYRCTATAAAASTSVPSNCTAIAGKTGTTYTVTATDVNKYIRFGSKAHNSAGDTISLSKSTAKVAN